MILVISSITRETERQQQFTFIYVQQTCSYWFSTWRVLDASIRYFKNSMDW